LRKDSYMFYIGNWSRITEVPCHSSLEDVLVRFRGNTHRAEKRRQEKSGCNLSTVKKRTWDHAERGQVVILPDHLGEERASW
jgi:hypothetical protein